jgi:hypothetical protein
MSSPGLKTPMGDNSCAYFESIFSDERHLLWGSTLNVARTLDTTHAVPRCDLMVDRDIRANILVIVH